MSEAKDVVQEQVDAFNARDVERFAACYADEAIIVGPDGAVMVQGRPAIQEYYGDPFQRSPELHAEIPTRIAVGDVVIDEERVSGVVAEGWPSSLHAAAAYHVTDGKIDRVQFFM